MPTFKFSARTAVLIIIIIVVAALRLASFYGSGPFTLFTPLGAIALFAGAYFKGWITPVLCPLLTLFISDVIVSFTLFPELRVGLLYSGWEWTYLAFALITLAGKFILRYVNIKQVVLAVLAATFIHWIVSDLGMCIQENRFTASLYIEKLVSAVSYELRFMAGTALYSAILFGGFELLAKKYPLLRIAANKNTGYNKVTI